MKKIYSCLICIFILINIHSQTVDTILNKKVNNQIVYTSYFSYTTHTPLFVSYILYKGGGNESRKGMIFKTTLYGSAERKDYAYSGYDIGHMCNAEDEAYDFNRELSTFDFINALPQTKELNRGPWKSNEIFVRNKSKKDSILIICGGMIFIQLLNGKIGIPSNCFKLIKNLTTNKINIYLYTNNENPIEEQITLEQFMDLISDLKSKNIINNLINN
jgi:endonuclease G, mitochondrial